MPSFTVTAAGQRVNLGISGTAQASFTVTNTSTQTLKGRMLTRPSDSASPDWFSVVGDSVRDFAPDAAEQVVVQLSVPSTAPPGPYSFRLDAVSAVEPDEDFTEGPSVAFDVEAQPQPKKKFPWVPWWILAIAGGVVLLIIIGVVVWLLVRGGETKVVSSGNATIPTNQVFDVEAGKVSPAGGRGADVLWQMINFVWKMAPAEQSKATLVNMGVVDFDAIDAEQLSTLTYTAEPIPSNALVNGDVFAVHSAKNNFAKVKVTALATELGVQWVTYRRG
jgi:uncharacterized protein YfkK (UPF0435 family)